MLPAAFRGMLNSVKSQVGVLQIDRLVELLQITWKKEVLLVKIYIASYFKKILTNTLFIIFVLYYL